MARRKPASEYVLEIERLHNVAKEMPEGPGRTTIEAELHRKLGKWEKDKLSKVVYVANNEQKPWPLYEKVDLVTMPMKTKKETGHQQVGDYVCCVFIEDGRPGKPDGYHKYLPLVVERKTKEDCYSTIVPSDAWLRFKREINRFHLDKRFNRMVVIVECSLQDFLKYKPTVTRTKGGQIKFNRSHPIPPDVKRAKIAKCFVMGAPVLFADTTYQAMRMYKNLIRQTIIEQYDVLLRL